MKKIENGTNNSNVNCKGQMTDEEFEGRMSDAESLGAAAAVAAEGSAEQVNMYARFWNWDVSPEIAIPALTQSPKCTLTTACLVFAAGEADGYVSESIEEAHRTDNFGFMKGLHDRINSGIYPPEPTKFPLVPAHDDLIMIKLLFGEGDRMFKRPGRSEDGKMFQWALDPAIVNPTTLGLPNLLDSKRPQVTGRGRYDTKLKQAVSRLLATWR